MGNPFGSARGGAGGGTQEQPRLPLAIALIPDGCATFGSQPERAETQAQGDLSLTVASRPQRRRRTFMAPIWPRGISSRYGSRSGTIRAVPYWVLVSGLDPNYFAASEAADAFHATTADGADPALDERFDSLQFRNPVMPSATVSGFVLTNLDERVKVVDVDLIARGDARSFTFVAVAAGN
jgi:hypothetical protein